MISRTQGAALAGACASLLLVATPRAQGQHDDVLVNLFGASGATGIDHYRAHRLVVASPGVTAERYEGAALTRSGKFATTRRLPAGVNLYDPATGAEVATFDTPTIGFVPGDLDVFADGTLAVVEQTPQVHLYTESGQFVTTWTAPGIQRLFGCHVSRDDELWLCDIRGAGSNSGALFRLDRNGNLINSFATAFEPGDVVDAPDGTLWATDRYRYIVVQLDPDTGQVLTSFPTAVTSPMTGLGLASDGALYVTGENETRVFRYDQGGTLLSSFALSSPGAPLFLHVFSFDGARSTFRNGSGTNATGFTSRTLPRLGTEWVSDIATGPNTLGTWLGLAVSQGQSPLPGTAGELLLGTVPAPVFWFGQGTHRVPIPGAPGLLGVTLSSQGFRVEARPGGTPTLVPLNAQDLRLGT